MKKTFRKTASLILAAAIGALSFSSAIPAFAADEPIVIHVEHGETSEFGYQPYRYVDENGNEISFDNYANENPAKGSGVMVLNTESYNLKSASLPSSYDAREKGIITKVKNQGDAGNCWAHAAMSLMETSSVLKGYDTAEDADYSEAHLTWFTGKGLAEDENDLAYGDGYDLEDPYNYGGNWKRAAGAMARWSGVAEESEFPSYPRNVAAMGNYEEADRYNTSSGVILESAQALTDDNDVKQWIYENGSATVAFCQNSKYLNKETAAYCCLENYSVNHMITIVGWDDDYPVENFGTVKPSGNGAWLCKNSWGESWGDNGYFWLSYEDETTALFAGFTAQQADKYYKNYTYNGAEWNTAYGTYGSVQVANVFTATGNEKLTAVAVQTVGTNLRTRIKVYKGIADGCTNPLVTTLAASCETVLAREGYHTIYLDSGVPLEKGEKFSVVAEYYNLDTKITFFPVEDRTVDCQFYSSREGESFVNYGTSANSWQTAASEEFNNVFVQAFTECAHKYAEKTEGVSCTEDGVKVTYCEQCGKVESETAVSHTGHSFGTWSQFKRNADGDEISTRECIHCGETETRKLSQMNVVTVDSLFETLFARFIEIFRSLFSLK